MSSYIANIKITQRDIIKNWWKLNYFLGGSNPLLSISQRALFNALAVNDVRGLVADGYHVATLEDFGTLCVNITQLNIQNFGYRRFDNGLFVPEENFALWTSDIDEGPGFNACQETYNGACDSVASYNPNDGHIVRVVKDDDVDPGQYVGNDGKVYPTIKIGNQVWVFGNLDETKYRNNYTKYGYLYNWYAATDARNIASAGWHVPTLTEIQTLSTYLGGDSVSGKHLKENNLLYWNSITNNDNSSLFSMRGSGYRSADGFSLLKIYGILWTSTDYVSNFAYNITMKYNTDNLYTYNFPIGSSIKFTGNSIRLIKDDDTLAYYTGNDGKIYRTVKIGTQVWMADNLAETKYRDGSTIPNVTDNATWAGLTTGALCAYDNDETNVMLGDDIPEVTDDATWAGLTTGARCYFNNQQ